MLRRLREPYVNLRRAVMHFHSEQYPEVDADLRLMLTQLPYAGDETEGVSATAIANVTEFPRSTVLRYLERLAELGWAEQKSDSSWAMSDYGLLMSGESIEYKAHLILKAAEEVKKILGPDKVSILDTHPIETQ